MAARIILACMKSNVAKIGEHPLRAIYMPSRYLHGSTTVQNGNMEEFEHAKERLSKLREEPDNAMKLQLYALFKQATIGPCTSSRPGMTDFVGRAKWDAWKAIEKSTKDEARKQYISIINQLAGSEPSADTSKILNATFQSVNDDIVTTVRGKVHVITLNRPKKKNALKLEMYDAVVRALESAAADETSLTVLTGAGDYYCSGNDLSNFQSVTPANLAEMAASSRIVLERFVSAFIDFPKPLISLVNGPAVGISVTVLGLCDAVYATNRATFHTPFTLLGQSPEGCSTFTFPRAMGHARACQLLLFNEKITASEAKDCGLVSEVFVEEEFQTKAWDRVNTLAKLPARSLRESKSVIRSADRSELHAANERETVVLAKLWQSPECAAAIMDFFKHRH